MAMSSLNMIENMNKAWDEKQRLDLDTYKQHCKNLITHAFVELEKMYKGYCSNKGVEYKDEIFYSFQRILVYIMKCDGEFLQGEYDAYCLICDWAGIEPLSVNDVNALYSRTTSDDVISDIDLITGVREYMNPDNYRAMVLSFCYLSLLGDGSFDENEYYIIRCFYKPGYDYVPSTWEQFKQEW